MDKLTLKEYETQWRLHLKQSLTTNEKIFVDGSEPPDTWDCSSLAIPPTCVLVDRVSDRFIQEWRDLDDRKVVADSTDEEGDDDNQSSRSSKRLKRSTIHMPNWYDRYVRLPEQFDYATRRTAAPEDDNETGARVISLEDPTKTMSYHQELWNLFARIPTAQNLEERTVEGLNLPHSEKVVHEIVQGTQVHARLDAHALSRLRIRDRHQLPPTGRGGGGPLVASLRVECWKRQPRRGVSSDPNIMSLEFLGSQTLLDFHRAIVEQTDDILFDAPACANLSSGFFFIEDTFYTTGSVDYTTVIQTWLKSGTELKKRRRAKHLGLNVDGNLKIKAMSDAALEDIALRLGTRYIHVHNGDVECSVFVIDRRFTSQAKVPYPLLHDIWAVPQNNGAPTCDACQHTPAVVATSNTCPLTDGKHRALCESCARQLQLPSKAPQDVALYSVWRNQRDLSASVAASDERYF